MTKRLIRQKEDENIPKPTTEERIAALKKNFENVNAENVAFYQKLPNNFYSTIFEMTETEIHTVRDESLKLIDEQMSKQVRESELKLLNKKQKSKSNI